MSDTTKVACMLPLILDDTFNHVSVCVLEQSLISIFVFHFIPFQRVQISYNPLPGAVGKIQYEASASPLPHIVFCLQPLEVGYNYYIVIYYRMDLNFHGTKLSLLLQIGSHP